MKLDPVDISVAGPGIDLSDLPEGVSIQMADPVADFAYARNAVTLVYDLSDYEHVRLSFAAKEFGDEPHAPPPAPFGDEANFDGVAISTDGANWYEVQGLRSLRSDRFTDFDLDLDAAVVVLGLSYGSVFRIRFCQYDNNPAPMDGIFIHRIALTAEPRAPIFHLPLDDNADSPTVRDISEAGRDQVLIDPTGDPNTAAHSVPGPDGTTALAFDGIDDRIEFGPTLLGDLVGQGRDFTITLRYKTDANPGSSTKAFFCRRLTLAQPHLINYVANDRLYWRIGWGDGYVGMYSQAGMLNGQWRHVACRRQGQTLTLWVDGAVHETKSHPDYAQSLFGGEWGPRAIGQVYGGSDSDWPFALADFRAYDRALFDWEIEAMGQ